jgi:hypothetical protein
MSISLRRPVCCPKCGLDDLHRSKLRKVQDWLLGLVLCAYRCEFCYARYWCLPGLKQHKSAIATGKAIRGTLRKPARVAEPQAMAPALDTVRFVDRALQWALGIGENPLLVSPHAERLTLLPVVRGT